MQNIFRTSAEFFSDIWEIPAARLIVGIAVLASLVLILFYVIKKVRGMALGKERADFSEHLSEFRQMYEEGKLDEQDFKRVKEQITKQATSGMLANVNHHAVEGKPASLPHSPPDSAQE